MGLCRQGGSTILRTYVAAIAEQLWPTPVFLKSQTVYHCVSGIFISYGHDKFVPVVERLYNDLEEKRFEVFMDKRGIRPGSRFDIAIEEAINNCDYFVSILSTHSTRASSVCLDEITAARALEKGIMPIRFETVNLPFLIMRYQWMDLFISTDADGNPVYSEADYKNVLSYIETTVRTKKKIVPNEKLADIKIDYKLRAFDYSYIITSHSKDFVGRAGLSENLLKWMETDSDPVYWLLGDAGSGKTSFVSNLVSSGNAFNAIHFCQSNNHESVEPKNILLSFVYQLCISDHDYLDTLIGAVDPSDIIDCDLDELTIKCLVEVPSKMAKRKRIALMVDAIDELEKEDQKAFLDALYNALQRDNCQITCVMTSRPNDLVLTYIANHASRNIRIDSGKENTDDCRNYIIQRLSSKNIEANTDVIGKILEVSESNFLYLKFLMDDISQTGKATADSVGELPKKLGGIYLSYMNKLIDEIGDEYYDEQVAPVLEVMVAAKRPLSIGEIAEFTDCREKEVKRIFRNIRSMIKKQGEQYAIYHRSLEMWLTDLKMCDVDYYIEKKNGQKTIVKKVRESLQNISKRPEGDYIKEYGFGHLIDAGQYDDIAEMLVKADDDTVNLFYMRFSDLDVDTIYNTMNEISKRVDEEQFIAFILNSMSILRYQRYIDKAMKVCERFLSNSHKYGPAITASIITQKGNNYRYLKEAKYDLAMPLFEEALGIFDGLPESKMILYMRSLSNEGVAVCYKAWNQKEESAKFFAKAFEYSRKCFEMYPDKMTRHGLAIDYANMALVYKWKEDAAAVSAAYKESYRLFKENYTLFPAYDTRRDYMVGLNRMGRIAEDGGLKCFMTALELAEENCKMFPSLQSKRDVARSHVYIGDYYSSRDKVEAEKQYEAAVEIQKGNFETYMSIQNAQNLTETLRKLYELTGNRIYLEDAASAIEECLKSSSSEALQTKLSEIKEMLAEESGSAR